MSLRICILAFKHNSLHAYEILNWFQQSYSLEHFHLVTTINEIDQIKPNLIVVLLLAPYGNISGNYVEIRDIAPFINKYNVVCYRVKPYDKEKALMIIPEDIKNDHNNYYDLFKTLGVPNNKHTIMGEFSENNREELNYWSGFSFDYVLSLLKN